MKHGMTEGLLYDPLKNITRVAEKYIIAVHTTQVHNNNKVHS